MKRLFDVFAALTALLVLSPFLLVLALLVALTSPGGAFFSQQRVGMHGKLFSLHKFRTMKPASESQGQLTVGGRDPRITRIGYFLRKFKLDELPQLWNVVKGEMSLVGPRPEVPRYVEMYDEQQRKVLSIRPGLTDYASLEYLDENELLGKAKDPEKTYIEEIMPAKLKLSLLYMEDCGMRTDLKILARTVARIIRG